MNNEIRQKKSDACFASLEYARALDKDGYTITEIVHELKNVVGAEAFTGFMKENYTIKEAIEIFMKEFG